MADDRTYNVICGDGCLFEGMTKEQILTAIEQAVSSGTIQNVDTGFVTKIKEQNGQTALTFWVGTSAAYNAITEKENNCFYLLTDDTEEEDINAAIAELKTAIEAMTNKRGKSLFSADTIDNAIPHGEVSGDYKIKGLGDFLIVSVTTWDGVTGLCNVARDVYDGSNVFIVSGCLVGNQLVGDNYYYNSVNVRIVVKQSTGAVINNYSIGHSITQAYVDQLYTNQIKAVTGVM